MSVRSAAAPAWYAVLLLSGCGIIGSDDDALRVAISVEVSEPSITVAAEGPQQIACTATLQATATGSANAVAKWEGGELRWYGGLDRTTPAQTDRLTRDDVHALWQGGVLKSGETATVQWDFWAGVPFVVEAAFQYGSGRGDLLRSAVARIGCGLDAAMASAPPPSVRDLAIEAPTPFQPGDSFTVTYLASAPGGLWRSRVILNGAYHQIEVIAERLLTESRQTVRLIVPPGVALGVPIDVTVDVIDAFGQASPPVSIRSVPLMDVTPPWSRFTTGLVLAPGDERVLVGQYAIGDTLQLLVAAGDNHRLGELVVSFGADRRSTALAGFHLIDSFGFEIEPAWIGAPGFVVHVTDAQGWVGPQAYAHPDSIRVYAVSPRPTTTWSTAGTFISAAWDEVRERLYVVPEDGAEVIVVSTTTMTTNRRIRLPAAVGGVDFTAGGDSLVLSLPGRGTVAIVDLIGDDRVIELPLEAAGLTEPQELRVLADGRALIVARHTDGSMRIADLVLATGTVVSATTLPEPSFWRIRMERDRDRSVVGTLTSDGCLIIYAAATDRFDPCIRFPHQWGQLSTDAAGSRFIVTGRVIDVATRSVREPAWGLSPWGFTLSVFSSDGESIFISDVKGLIRIRTADGVALERIPLPMVYGRILPSTDGSRLLTVSNESDVWPYTIRVDRVMLR